MMCETWLWSAAADPPLLLLTFPLSQFSTPVTPSLVVEKNTEGAGNPSTATQSPDQEVTIEFQTPNASNIFGAKNLPSPEEYRKRKVALISGITGQDGCVLEPDCLIFL